jgi:hypothetical protein
MSANSGWLAGGTLGLTLLMLLGLWVLAWTRQDSAVEVNLLGVPAGQVAVSLGSIGITAALAFRGVLDAQIAGTLLGAHVGYHAAAFRRSSG